MREIKFRGKRLDNGEWVFGDLTTKRVSIRFVGDTCIFDGNWYVVDSTTVGQYTGLKDSNGKEIYEGDIIEYEERPNEPFKVVWVATLCGFRAANNKFDFFHIRLATSYNSREICQVTVLGNVHDNPVLMKGGAE